MLETDVNKSAKDIEQRLVRALKKRDPRAFEELVSTHQHRVFSLCLRMLNNLQEAEDLAQEVFFTVFNSIDSFRAESLLSTWIYKIARNHCLNRIKFLKRRAHKKKQSLAHTSQAALKNIDCHPVVASRIPGPDRMYEGKQMEAIIQEQIADLSEEHRELILLRDIEHLNYEEIQAITGLAIGTVKSRLHRARMELARRMTPYLGQE
jgi:RNA polymerase sigma-70 factor (ECF subfamily)